MKKSVLMLILAVYIVSVCVVGFLCTNVKIYNPTVAVEKVEITEVEYNNKKQDIDILQSGNEVYSSVTIKEIPSNPAYPVVIYYKVTGENGLIPTDPKVICRTDPSADWIKIEQQAESSLFKITVDMGSKNIRTFKIIIASNYDSNKYDEIVINIQKGKKEKE